MLTRSRDPSLVSLLSKLKKASSVVSITTLTPLKRRTTNMAGPTLVLRKTKSCLAKNYK